MRLLNRLNNDCCCTCGLKKGICIVNQLVEDSIITNDNLTAYYNDNKFIKNIKLDKSKYPNLINIKYEGTSIIPNPENCLIEQDEDINLCLEFLNAIEINIDDSDIHDITNVLNKNYYHLLKLDTPCQENCCCKYSFIALFKDIYISPDINSKKFKLGVSGICKNLPISDIGNVINHKLIVIALDCDVGWFLYREVISDNGEEIIVVKIYLVPLCKIYGVIN